MSKKTSQLKVAKAQRKVVDAFVKNHSDIILTSFLLFLMKQ
jgi:hypothetical protein